jgi:hypothetical protein
VKVFVRLYLKPTFLGNMADDLSKMWETFTLTESEDLEFDIPRGEFREVVPRGQVCMPMVDFDGTISPSEYTFAKATFWVRMVNLPLACIGLDIGRKISASMGEVEVVDMDGEGIGLGEFLRVRILVDLSKPLPRG